MVALVVNGRSLLESKKQEFTAYKDIILYAPLNTPLPTLPAMPVLAAVPGFALAAVIPRARQRAERIKAHPAYTNAIGEDSIEYEYRDAEYEYEKKHEQSDAPKACVSSAQSIPTRILDRDESVWLESIRVPAVDLHR